MNKFLKNKDGIIKWLEKYNIQNYKLILDDKYGYVVDVDSDVDLSGKGLKHIPVKFGNVGGYFYCYHNNLTSLQFCPRIVNSHFSCSNNNLISLEGCPTTIGGDFSCSHNNLTSLEFCPLTVKGNFSCNNNNLTSLEFCPHTVGGDFYCHNNQIANLTHFPNYIGGEIYLKNNNLININGGKYYKFEEIHRIHLEHKITAEKELFENSISEKINFDYKKTSSLKTNKLKI